MKPKLRNSGKLSPRVRKQRQKRLERVIRRAGEDRIYPLGDCGRKKTIMGLTPAEDAFARKAARKGWKVYRNGWPDFLCTDPDTGATFFVEVKAENDSIRVEQETTFAVLELAGITVRIFTPGKDTLVHWRTYAYPNALDRGAGRSQELLSRRLASVVLADEEARAGARDAAGTVAPPADSGEDPKGEKRTAGSRRSVTA